MKLAFISLLLTFSVCVAGCSMSSESYVRAGYDFSHIDQVAVIDVVGVIECDGVKKQIEDGFTAYFLQKGYAPVVKEYVRRQLDQNGFDGHDLTPEVFAIEAGRILDVPAVLLISVPTFGDEMSITAKLIEVEGGSVLWIGQASKSRIEKPSIWDTNKKDDFDAEFEQAMMIGYGSQPYDTGYDYQNEAVDSQDMSEMLDCSLTPEEEKKVFALIGKVCESLPYKSSDMTMGEDSYNMHAGSIFDINPDNAVRPAPPTGSRSEAKFNWRSLID